MKLPLLGEDVTTDSGMSGIFRGKAYYIAPVFPDRDGPLSAYVAVDFGEWGYGVIYMAVDRDQTECAAWFQSWTVEEGNRRGKAEAEAKQTACRMAEQTRELAHEGRRVQILVQLLRDHRPDRVGGRPTYAVAFPGVLSMVSEKAANWDYAVKTGTGELIAGRHGGEVRSLDEAIRVLARRHDMPVGSYDVRHGPIAD